MSQDEVFKCIIQESMGFGVGIVAGTAMSLRTKKIHHLALWATLGTGFDLVYAVGIKCRPLLDAYQASTDLLEAEKKRAAAQQLLGGVAAGAGAGHTGNGNGTEMHAGFDAGAGGDSGAGHGEGRGLR
jgi:hypothetical protein